MPKNKGLMEPPAFARQGRPWSDKKITNKINPVN